MVIFHMTTTATHKVNRIFRPSTVPGNPGELKPSIRITGKLLESIGLQIGSRVRIIQDGERLIIQPA